MFCKVCFFLCQFFQTVHYSFFYIISISHIQHCVLVWYTLMPQNAQTKVPTCFRPPLYTSLSKGISICTSGSCLGSVLLKVTVLTPSTLTGNTLSTSVPLLLREELDLMSHLAIIANGYFNLCTSLQKQLMRGFAFCVSYCTGTTVLDLCGHDAILLQWRRGGSQCRMSPWTICLRAGC